MAAGRGRRREGGPLRPRGGRGTASTGGEGLPQGQRSPGMAARAGGAPFWGTQAQPGRVGNGRGRGRARRLLFSAPLGLGPLPFSPVPYTLHPLLPLPPTGSCFTSPPLGPQEPAAHGEDTEGSASSGGCGIQYGGHESGRAARRSAAPASAPPGDWTARASAAARKPSSELGPERRRPEAPLGSVGPGDARVLPPPRARLTREPPLRCGRPPRRGDRSLASLLEKLKCAHKAAS